MKKNIYIFAIINLLFCGVFADNFKSNINVIITERNKTEMTSPYQVYPQIINVRQTLFFNNCEDKNVTLYLANVNFLQHVIAGVFFMELSVEEKTNEKIKPISFKFDGKELSFKIPKKDCQVEVSYYYQSDFASKNLGNTAVYLNPCMFDWHSWYFTSTSMELSDVKFIVDKNQNFFTNSHVNISDDNTYSLKFDNTCNQNIDFYLFNKDYYEEISVMKDSLMVNIFLHKGVICQDSLIAINNDNESDTTCILSPGNRINPTLKKIVSDNILEDIDKLCRFFEFNKECEINIIDGVLQIGKKDDGTPGGKFRWGNATEMNTNQHFILIDTSFWETQDLIHELLHIFNPCVPSTNDSTYYFFRESMTEYLATCFKYDVSTIRDSIFERGLEHCKKWKDYDRVSVIGLFENKSFLGEDMATMDSGAVIYAKTPFVIHEFAKRIGEERFMELLCEFYKQVNIKSTINFKMFESCLRTNGVTDEDWLWFVDNL